MGEQVRIHRCSRRDDYFEMVNSAEFTERWMLESHLARRLSGLTTFTLPGICAACMQAVDLQGNFEGVWIGPDGLRVPNWRECLVCPSCRMNGRQRNVARRVTDLLLDLARGQAPRLYVMEQLSPLHDWIRRTFPWAECVGSEYLGPEVPRGAMRGELRNEDAEALSFDSGSFDLVVSCDVFEHVNDPDQAFREVVRVLKPGGQALLTFPMDPHLDANQRRALLTASGLELLAPPIYHGNPLSPEGSLVITDFGWEVLDQLRSAGLRDAALNVYWSFQHGYLGIQFYFSGSTARE